MDFCGRDICGRDICGWTFADGLFGCNICGFILSFKKTTSANATSAQVRPQMPHPQKSARKFHTAPYFCDFSFTHIPDSHKFSDYYSYSKRCRNHVKRSTYL